MKLVKFRLADSCFWFLGKAIALTKQNPTTDLININSFEHEEIQIINKGIKRGEIRVFDTENSRLDAVEEVKIVNGELAVGLEDIKEEESTLFPEVFSVTIENESEEKEEKKGPEEEDYIEAEILLNKNGNTVKKTIKNIPNTEEGLVILHACLTVEKSNKNRIGVVSMIEQRIMEF